jgi:hypothetical protein
VLPTSKSHGMILSGALMVLALALIACPASAGDGWITGTVSESGGSIFGIPIPGDPISGATVTLVGSSNSVNTDSNGDYNITVPAGNCTLQVSASGFNSQTSGTIKVTEGNTTANQDFIMERPSGNLTGTVTDYDDGAPISYAIITYQSGGLLPPTAMTDSSGRYLLSNLPVGSLKMSLTVLPPYLSQNFSVPIKAGFTSTKDFSLRAISYIVMAVKDSGGKPLPGATVTAGTNTNTTDTSGAVSFVVAPGSYQVEVAAEGYTTAKLTIAVEKGNITSSEVRLSKIGGGGGAIGGGGSMLLVAGAAAGVVVVLGLIGFMMMRKKKKAPAGSSPGSTATGPAPAFGAPAAPGEQAPWETGPVPGRPKTEAEKMKEWADYERMYGRPHPESPGWVSGGAAMNAPKPKCPIDDIVVSYEPYSGQYFCSKCHERYPAEKVFGQAEPSQQPAPAPRPQYQPPSETQYAPSGPQQQPSWTTQTQTAQPGAPPLPMPLSGEQPLPPPPEAPQPPPTAAPMEAQLVQGGGEVPEAKPLEAEAILPDAGPVFNLPPPVSYEDGTLPPPPRKPPEEK